MSATSSYALLDALWLSDIALFVGSAWLKSSRRVSSRVLLGSASVTGDAAAVSAVAGIFPPWVEQSSTPEALPDALALSGKRPQLVVGPTARSAPDHDLSRCADIDECLLGPIRSCRLAKESI